MIDAAPEEANGIQLFFPSTFILMFWFYGKKNLRSPKYAGRYGLKTLYHEILKVCDSLSYSQTFEIFEARKIAILAKWSMPRDDEKV